MKYPIMFSTTNKKKYFKMVSAENFICSAKFQFFMTLKRFVFT